MAEQDDNSEIETDTTRRPQRQIPQRETPPSAPNDVGNEHIGDEESDIDDEDEVEIAPDNFRDMEEVDGGKIACCENTIFVQPTGDKNWFYYHEHNDTWYEGNVDNPGVPIDFLSKKKRNLLTGLHLEKARKASLMNTPESIALIEYVKNSGGWSPQAKATGAICAVALASAAGALLYKEYGPKIINNVPGADVHHYHNETFGDHFNVLLKEVKEKAKDVWTPAQIDQNWGKNTSDNISALENILAKDGVADALWDSSVYQAALKASGVANKEALYNKTFGELAQLVNDIGVKDGIEFIHSQALAEAKEVTQDIPNLTKPYEGATPANISALDELIAKDNVIEELMKITGIAQNKEQLYSKNFSELVDIARVLGSAEAGKVIDAAHSAVMAQAKSALSDVYTEKELNDKYGGSTVDNITALEHLVSIDPQIDFAFGNSHIANYFSHTGLTKEGAYTDKNLPEKLQNGIEYEFYEIQYNTNLTADRILELTGEARTNAIDSMQYISANYNWLGGNYDRNITEELTDKIALNATLANSTLGKAILDASNFGADKVGAYKTADGAFIQTNGGSAGKAGAEGGYKISAAEYDLLKNL